MGGGQDEPCVPRAHLALIERKLGRPCPRVDVDAENAPALPLFSSLFAEHLRPLAPALWGELAETIAPEERLPFLLRLVRAASSDAVIARMYPVARGK